MHHPLKKHFERSLMKSNHSKGAEDDIYSRDEALVCLAAVVLLITLLSLMLYFLSSKLSSDVDDDHFYDEEDGNLEQQD